MKYKIGQKVRLDLKTERGNRGIPLDRHGKTCTIINNRFYLVRDESHLWSVDEGMLQPLKGAQLLFDFMYKD